MNRITRNHFGRRAFAVTIPREDTLISSRFGIFIVFLRENQSGKRQLTDMNIQAIIHTYYKEGTELYDIYQSHCTDVTNKALSIVHKHPELAVDIRLLKRRACCMILGFYDQGSSYRLQRHVSLYCHGYLGTSCCKRGFPRHGLVCERHTGTGRPADHHR